MDKGRLARHFLPMMPKSPRFPPNSSRIVEVLAYPSVKLLDVTGPIQVFASANDLAAEAEGTSPYTLRVVAQGGLDPAAQLGAGRQVFRRACILHRH